MTEPLMRASNSYRRLICAGSARMEMGLPDDTSDLARKGVLLHSYSQNRNLDRSFLPNQDQDLLSVIDEIQESVLTRVSAEFSLRDAKFEEGYEKELWVKRDNVPVISGHCDRFRRYPEQNLVVILETKTGYQTVEPAETNTQTRCYAVASKDEWETTERVVVAIVQPRLSFAERCTMAVYELEEIEASRAQLMSILDAISKPDAKLTATEIGCRYCRAKLVCSAFRESMMLPAVLTPDNALSKAAREAYLEQRLAELADDQLEKVIMACSLAKMVYSPASDEVRKRIPEGGMTNFTLAKDSEVREVVDVRKAMALLSLAGLEKSTIFDCVTEFSVGKLDEIVRKIHPTWTWKQTKDWTNKKLGSVIELQTRKGRIIRK